MRKSANLSEPIGCSISALRHLIEAVREGIEISRVDASCFDGRYITGNVSADFLQTVAGTRSDQAKTQRIEALDVAEISAYH